MDDSCSAESVVDEPRTLPREAGGGIAAPPLVSGAELPPGGPKPPPPARPPHRPFPGAGWELFRLIALVLLAVLTYTVTGEPWLSALLPSLWAVRRWWTTGIWLLRCDPSPKRARVLQLFYLATGLLEAAATVLLCLLAIVFVRGARGEPVSGSSHSLQMVVLTFLGELLASGLLGICSFAVAMYTGVRVWVHPSLRWVLGGDLRNVPFLNTHRQRLNYAELLLGMSLPLVFAGLALITLILVGQLPPAVLKGPMSLLVLLAILAMFVLSGSFTIACAKLASMYVIARHPWECWMVLPPHRGKGNWTRLPVAGPLKSLILRVASPAAREQTHCKTCRGEGRYDCPWCGGTAWLPGTRPGMPPIACTCCRGKARLVCCLCGGTSRVPRPALPPRWAVSPNYSHGRLRHS